MSKPPGIAKTPRIRRGAFTLPGSRIGEPLAVLAELLMLPDQSAEDRTALSPRLLASVAPVVGCGTEPERIGSSVL